MHNYFAPPPPPPPPQQHGGQWLPPPPPPVSRNNPLEVPVEWYIDIPSTYSGAVGGSIPRLNQTFHTSVSVIPAAGNGPVEWMRYCIFGKPIGIHHTIAELKKIAPVVEIGFTRNAPPPPPSASNEDEAEPIPVYHAAWVEFTSRCN